MRIDLLATGPRSLVACSDSTTRLASVPAPVACRTGSPHGLRTAMPTALIIGASVAGTRVALDLRRLGFAGDIVLTDEQFEPPYDRPALSKGLLTSADGVPVRMLSREQAAGHGIALHLGFKAVGLDTAGKSVLADDGTRLGYDHLIIATGARS